MSSLGLMSKQKRLPTESLFGVIKHTIIVFIFNYSNTLSQRLFAYSLFYFVNCVLVCLFKVSLLLSVFLLTVNTHPCSGHLLFCWTSVSCTVNVVIVSPSMSKFSISRLVLLNFSCVF